jgi:D-amino-acid dehydrogenase
MDDKQIVIIGGGLQGLATANALLDRGENVIILEKEADIGRATSFANAGMLTPSQSMPWNSPSDILKIISGLGKKDSPMILSPRAIPSLFFWGLKFLRNSTKKKFIEISKNGFELARYSSSLTKEIREKESFEYDHDDNGTLKVFHSQEALDRSVEITKILDPSLSINVMDSREVSLVEPALAPIVNQLVGGIHYLEDEIGDAYKFCKLLEDLVRSKGGRIFVNTDIKKILIHKGRVNGVITDRAILQTKRIVVAAGSWSHALLKQVGLRLPVRPVKGYSLTLDTAGLNNKPKLAVLDESTHTAVTPLGNRIRIAGTAEFTGFDDDIHPKRIVYLNEMLKAIYPKLYSQLDLEEGRLWYGFRPTSADGLPFLGKTKIEGLFVNSGQGHSGWTLAMGSASLVADLIVNKSTDIDPSPYLASRSL